MRKDKTSKEENKKGRRISREKEIRGESKRVRMRKKWYNFKSD